MNRIRVIGRRFTLLIGLAVALLAVTGAVPAFARPAPPLNAGFGGELAPASPPSSPFYAGGMAGWEIALIVVGAVITAAVAAVLIARARRAHRDELARPARDASTTRV